MQFKDAAYEILKTTGEPLHYNEITDRAIDAGILTTTGQTPHASMGALLYTDTLKEDPRFRRGDRKGFFTLRTEPPTEVQRQINAINSQVKKTLRSRLQQMEPRKFENLVKSLLDEMGLDETSMTSYSGDSGIDVRGTLNAENLSEINVAVQAKRWKNNVGPKIVRELRGSLQVHEHGIVITPSDFTASAQAEADEPGKTHISLINGEQLVDLLIEHQVGVAKEEHIVPVLDEEYWSEILGEDFIATDNMTISKTEQEKKIFEVKFPLVIQAIHQGQIYKAKLLDLNGNVSYGGRVYDSPSGAAKEVAKSWKSVNGWAFWSFYNLQSNQWMKISSLRN